MPGEYPDQTLDLRLHDTERDVSDLKNDFCALQTDVKRIDEKITWGGAFLIITQITFQLLNFFRG